MDEDACPFCEATLADWAPAPRAVKSAVLAAIPSKRFTRAAILFATTAAAGSTAIDCGGRADTQSSFEEGAPTPDGTGAATFYGAPPFDSSVPDVGMNDGRVNDAASDAAEQDAEPDVTTVPLYGPAPIDSGTD